jgi:hypothetical protein
MRTTPMAPPSRPGPKGGGVRVYYSGPYAYVTESVFESWSPTYRRFAVAELSEVDIALAEAPPDRALIACVNAGVLALVADLAGRPTLGTLWSWVVGAAAVLTVAGVIAFRYRYRPRPLELLGWYRSEYVVLFRCTDDRVFGQVSRALRRSLEHRDDHGTSTGPA